MPLEREVSQGSPQCRSGGDHRLGVYSKPGLHLNGRGLCRPSASFASTRQKCIKVVNNEFEIREWRASKTNQITTTAKRHTTTHLHVAFLTPIGVVDSNHVPGCDAYNFSDGSKCVTGGPCCIINRVLDDKLVCFFRFLHEKNYKHE